MRLGVRVSSTLSYLLPDLLGSPTVALTSTGSFQAVQLFSPYGTSRYSSGNMPTDYNFTGQRLDSETGLIYDNFRYYDPVSGRFTRADTVDTNARGLDGYGYVGDNPEGRTDPTGHCWPLCTMIIGAVIGAAVSVATTAITSAVQGKTPTAGQLLQAAAVGAVTGAITGLVGPEAGPIARIAVGAVASGAGQMVGNAISGKPLMDGVVQATVTGAITGGLIEGAGALFKGFSGEATEALEGTTCSFTFDTRVATAHSKQAIGKLHAGEKVLAYNPKTHKMELQPILHVWINHDNDLVDLTLTTTLKTRQGHGVSRQSELIHTNQKHPFFTQEQGFLAVGQLKLGMPVLRADGLWGVVTGWKMVPGSRTMYNLEVAQDHTFTVGTDEWVVHNCPTPDPVPPSFRTKVLTTDAYRSGSPNELEFTLGNKEIDANGNVKMGWSNGVSHFDRMVSLFDGKTIYQLDAGTEAPDGLTWAYKWNSNWNAYHIGLQPEAPMSYDVYQPLAESLRSLYHVFAR